MIGCAELGIEPPRGKNSRRSILGALSVRSGELVTTVRERCRTDDAQAAVEALGLVRPDVPKLLI
jgi:hypothetical protein